jgi:hypothetical protein
VFKSADIGGQFVQYRFPRMAEGTVPQIMSQQIASVRLSLRFSTRPIVPRSGRFNTVCHAGPVLVVQAGGEDLRLSL